MTEALRNIIARNRAGRRVAIVSVCSAQPDVLRASIAMAQRLDRQVVIEATSNQVNQDGGYTGITPSEFIGYVHGLADDVAADRERIIFGGDHLGTQAWRRMNAKAAMAKAEVLASSDQTPLATVPQPPPTASMIVGTKVMPCAWHSEAVSL